MNIRIIHEPSEKEAFLILDKDAGLPSAPLYEGDLSAFSLAAKIYPQLLNVRGQKDVEHGLLHRIDTDTNGLLLIAASQQAYDSLFKSQKEGLFQKYYRAEVDFISDSPQKLGAFPPLPEKFNLQKNGTFLLESMFRPYGKKGSQVRPVTEDCGMAARKKSGGRLYKTEINLMDKGIALCKISAGYRHQVRCHLSWAGLPVKNDRIYNPSCLSIREDDAEKKSEEQMKFTACKITFPDPLTGSLQVFEK